jgi:hypothetical protein
MGHLERASPTADPEGESAMRQSGLWCAIGAYALLFLLCTGWVTAAEASPDLTCPSCADLDPCTIDTCDTSTGTCRHDPFSCDDHSPCTLDECDPGTPGACHYQPNSGASCDDGNSCTSGDTCSWTGVCQGAQLPAGTTCDDQNSCTSSDVCNQNGTCAGSVNAGSLCDDHNSCTSDDVCGHNGVCAGSPLAGGSACDDGNGCTLSDTCVTAPNGPPQCQGTPKNCDDESPCTTDQCDPSSGTCAHPPKSCDDLNPCTTDQCDPANGNCLRTILTGSCSDGNACTDGDVCSAGNCLPGPPTNCDDGNECSFDHCDPSFGCHHTFQLGSPCGGPPPECHGPGRCSGDVCIFPPQGGPCGPPCNRGICSITGSLCQFQTNPCIDSNPCTNDLCTSPEGVAVCEHTPFTGSCDDFNVCTANDSCQTGTCTGTPAAGSCDDLNSCTTNDQCQDGVCAGTSSGGTPQITVSLSPSEIAPPNHRFVEIQATVTATDSCGVAVPVVLTSIVSNEPDDAPGAGDGNTLQDIRDVSYGTADFRFLLRSERDARGSGRTYLVTYTATSSSGETAQGTATVSVGKGAAVNHRDQAPLSKGADRDGRKGKGGSK